VTTSTPAAHPPVGQHPVPVPGARGQVGQGPPHRRGHHQVLPADLGLDPAGQAFQARGILRPHPAAQVLGGDHPVAQLGCQDCRLDRPADLGRPERQVAGHRGRVEAGGRLASDGSELLLPQLQAGADAEDGGLEGERADARPLRVPGRGTEQQQGDAGLGEPADHVRVGVGQLFDRAGHQSNAAQQGFPDGEPGDGVRLGQSGKPGQVDHQGADPRLGQRGGGGGHPTADQVLLEVHQADAGSQRHGQLLREGRAEPVRVREQGAEFRLGGVIAEEVRDHPVRHPEGSGEQRPVRVLDHDQPVADQRPARLQPSPDGGRQPGCPGQLERESHGNPAPGDVVIQVAVEPFEAGVQIRHRRDHEKVDIQRCQPGIPGQPEQTGLGPCRLVEGDGRGRIDSHG